MNSPIRHRLVRQRFSLASYFREEYVLPNSSTSTIFGPFDRIPKLPVDVLFPSPRKLNDCQHRRSDKSPRKRRRFDAKCRPRRRRGSCTEIDGQSHSSRWILALSRRETGSRWSTLPSRERERQMRFFRLGWARESLIYHRGRMGLIVRRVVCAASSVINLTLVCRYCWLYEPSL